MAGNDLKVRISADVQGFKKDMQDAAGSVSEFKKETNDANTAVSDYQSKLSKSDMGIKSFSKQLRQARQDALDLASAFRNLTPEQQMSGYGKQLKAQVDEAVKEAARLKDLKVDMDRQIKNLASDTRGFDTAKESIGLMMNSMGSLASIYATVTGDQEAYNRAVTIFTGTQQTLNALTAIQNTLQKESNVYRLAEAANLTIINRLRAAHAAMAARAAAATGAEATAQGADAAATAANAAAHRALNMAMKAGPYVIIAAALAAIAGSIKLVTSLMDSYKKKIEDVNKAYESTTKYTEEYKNLTAQVSRSAVEQATKLRVLYKVITDGNKSYKERANAINEVKKIVPDYHASITKEGVLINNNVEAINNYIRNLKKAIDAQVAYQSAVNKGLELNSSKFAEKALEDRITYLKQQLGAIDPRLAQLGKYEHMGGGYFEKKGGKATEGFFIKDSGQLQQYKVLREQMAAANEELAEQHDKTKVLAADYNKATDAAGKLAYEIEKAGKVSGNIKTPKITSEGDKYEKMSLEELVALRKKYNEEANTYYKQGDEKRLRAVDEQISKIDAVIAKIEELNEKYRQQNLDPSKLVKTTGIAVPLNVTPVVDENYLKTAVGKLNTILRANDLKQQADKLQKDFFGKLAPNKRDIQNYEDSMRLIMSEMSLVEAEIDKLLEQDPNNVMLKEIKIKLKTDFDVDKDVDDATEGLEERLKGFAESLSGSYSGLINDFKNLGDLISDGNMFEDLNSTAVVLGSSLSLVGESLGNIGAGLEELGAGGAVAKAGAIAAAIGQIVLSFAMASRQAAEASAGWGWLVWVGAGLAALSTTIATISKFENGGFLPVQGIVGGSNFHGDRNIIRVNSGEMILNTRQQKRLFDAIDSDKLGAATQPIVMDVKVQGTDIWLTQRNLEKQRKLSGKR